MSQFSHSPVFIHQGYDTTTSGSIAAIKCKNISNRILKVGENVIWDVEFATTSGSQMCMNVTASSTNHIRSRVLGGIEGEDVSPGAIGNVRVWGRSTDCWVTGTVSKGDWLCLTTDIPGTARRHTAAMDGADPGICFAIANTSSSGNRAKIDVTYVLWRVN